MIVVKLTSAVGVGRPAVYVNVAHIVSFTDQTGGCQIRVSGGNNVIAVTESAEKVANLIAALERR
ncbi:hypothetical protein [uncultured Devosia sp.]|uniref:hypothetical protein n=1 Tax=uncultured Devosia sp. TaxID=211434 RepID=UPI00260E9C2B|nr:hypothetical protein [uncultured Devosia sp.]